MTTSHNIELYRYKLQAILAQFSDIPSNQLEEFISIFSLDTFKKRTFIIGPNAIKNFKFYFIINGLVRNYYIAEHKEITSDFNEDNSFFLNRFSLYTKLPNVDFFETLTDTICLVADYEAVEYLSAKYHNIEHLGRKIVEFYYGTYLKANYNKLFLSAEERYYIFTRERPSLLNKVSLKHIASHLGIQPATLSRLRANIKV